MLELWDGTRKNDKQSSYSLESTSNQPTRWLVLCWNTFGARTSHGRFWTHKTHHGPTWGKPPPSPIWYTLHLFARPTSKWLFVPGLLKGSPETARLDLLQLCGAIISCSDLRSGRSLKKNYSSCWGLSNGVLHVTCTHGNWVDSRHFVVGSQIASLTPNFSFDHNWGYRCSNGSCKPILDIYTSIAFQWYKELVNARFFDLWNRSLKVQESVGTPTPEIKVHLGVWVFILTLFHTPLGLRPCKILLWLQAQG